MSRIRAQAIIIKENSALFAYGNIGNDQYRHSFIGGGIEPGESAEAALLRELSEESGLEGQILFSVPEPGSKDHITFLVDIGSQTPKLGENPEEQDCPIGKKHLQKLLWLDLRNPVNFTDIDRHYFELLLEECEKRQYRSEWKVLIEKILEA